MKIQEIGEFGLIEKISRGCLVRPDSVIRAIGDDAAAFTLPPGEVALVTTDLLVEGVHFLRDAAPAADLGHKSLAVNLSDIAAMGGRAREAFVAVAIPADCPVEFIEEMYDGMMTLAARYEVNILGGDTTASRRDLVIDVTVVGSAAPEKLLYRHGARPGDRIVLTGPIGDSRAGCHLVVNRIVPDTDSLRKLFNAHIRPEPHLQEGRFLAETGSVHAAIDLSDGLSSDLGHILTAGGVGARLDARKIPISDELRAFCAAYARDPMETALSGGEDYVLLCALDNGSTERVCREFERRFHRPLIDIGEIIEGGAMELDFPDGRRETVTRTGWNHFTESSDDEPSTTP